MTKSEQQAVKEYFANVLHYTTKEHFTEHLVSALVFSYLMGMDPSECKYMCVESDWSREEVNEYDDIESFIHQMIREL